MARPLVHLTPQAKLQAQREKRKWYYQKHKDRINAKCRQQCQGARKNRKPLGDLFVSVSPTPLSSPMHDNSPDDRYEPSTLAECIAIVKEAKDELVALTKTPHAFAQGILSEYVETMPDDDESEEPGDMSIFERAIDSVEDIHGKAHHGQDMILQMCGICDEWWAADEVCWGI
ncbi:hypothetical protein M405DRAFT_869918 [Rhizopogon salebrosus TDB-379]|nr:hypothetical protein M405DRAFT_869918 [Rhizopogon salebrosus TDB-379]